MDIRRYFGMKAPSQLKSNPKLSPEKTLTKAKFVNGYKNHKKLEKEKPKKSRKRAILLDSESDEEDPIPRNPTKKIIEDDDCTITEYNSDSNSKKSVKKLCPLKIQKSPEPKLTKWNEETVSDYFGSSPIIRSTRVFLSKEEKKLGHLPTEAIHDDDEFEKTLMLLDEENEVRKNKSALKNSISPSPKKARTTKSPLKNCISPSPNKARTTKSPLKNCISPSPKKARTTKSPLKNCISPSPKKTRTSKSPFKNKTVESLEITINKAVNNLSPQKEEKKPEETQIYEHEESSSIKTSAEKRRNNFMNYRRYLNREGPKALGSKKIPEGEKGCLKGLTFVITGVLESLERDKAKELIEMYEGKVMQTVSKKTSYILLGDDPGPAKTAKAEKLGTKILNEDQLLELIRNSKTLKGSPEKFRKTSPNKNASSVKYQLDMLNSNIDRYADNLISSEDMTKVSNYDTKNMKVSPRKKLGIEERKKTDDSNKELELQKPVPKETSDLDRSRKRCNDADLTVGAEPKKNKLAIDSPVSQEDPQPRVKKMPNDSEVKMWVDKYKPTTTKQIIGQQGEKSGVNKLKKWLLSWYKSHAGKKKAVSGSRWGNDDGSAFKAALLSGPPGVGKTTSAQLVCKEAGFDYFELNASDTRSKRNLKEAVSELLGNQTLGDYFTGDSEKAITSQHVIIMDEVDGMAGNEDRGGIQELIALIKSSKIPIICICNDRSHPKMRSLVNYCFDLCFQRPRVEQIKSAMLSVCCKEFVKVPSSVMQDIIIASNQDIRQVLHNLSLWCANEKKLTEEQAKADIGRGTKHIKLNPFDVLRKVFSYGEIQKMTIHDKSDLFFHDYSIAPLFVQENYIHVKPHETGGNVSKHLQLLAATADSICDGDLVEKQIRSGGQWSLLPVEAIYASVIPGELLKGYLTQMINFPSWLGKNSSRNKIDRLLQELHMHMRLRITGNKTELNMDYLSHLKAAIAKPLIMKETEGVRETLNVLEHYSLLREDLDSIKDVSSWPGRKEFMSDINPKVKAALTRTYNKEGILTPFSVTNMKKIRKGGSKGSDDLLNGEEDIVEEEEDSNDDDVLGDAMVKVKKPTKQKNEEPSSSKGKGKGSRPRKQAKH